MKKNKAYLTWLGTLDDATRDLVQTIMAFAGAQIDERFNELADDIQRVERWQGKNIGRVDELQLRLDQYEKQQWNMAKEAIEQFAATMKEAQATIVSVRATIDPDSPAFYELTKSLREVSGAARSLRVLANTLDRNPQALISGNPENQEGK